MAPLARDSSIRRWQVQAREVFSARERSAGSGGASVLRQTQEIDRARSSAIRPCEALGIRAFQVHSEPRDPSLSRKPPETQGKRIRFWERTMVERNGESTPREAVRIPNGWFELRVRSFGEEMKGRKLPKFQSQLPSNWWLCVCLSHEPGVQIPKTPIQI